jgi:translation initiation factor IF-2
VYELAKELGMTNKECVDLCLEMGYPVKSHSSSLDEAYADQVRRKAIREGRTRDEQPEEPKKVAKKKAPAKKAPAKKAAKAESGDAAEEQPTEAAAPETTPVAEPAPVEAAPEAPSEQPTPEPAPIEAAEPTAPAAEAPAAAAAAEAPVQHEEPTPAPTAPAHKVVSSKPATGRPVRPVEAPTPGPAASAAPAAAPSTPGVSPRPAAPQPAPQPAPDQTEAPAAAAASDAGTTEALAPGVGTGESSETAGPPRSVTGKPIPPPPGPPRSASGKPIPPPPGLGGRRTAPARPGPGARPGGARPGPGTGIGRPGGPPGGPPGPGAPAGGFPPGGRGRPGGPQQRPPRRKGRRRRNREELQPMDVPTYTPAEAPVPEGTIVLERASSPQDLGPKLNRTAADVVRFLMQQGEMVTATQSLTDDMIELFAAEVGAEISLVDPGQEQEVELQRVLDIPEDEEADLADLPHRPPVVTVMGHVDHGKTKLLDYIRDANVVAGEAGGITQHIGAYQVDKAGRKITFIDTPGHAAFTAMRARGAEATDIVILVVAADDGVMPQTIEAIQHAKAAEVPIVVAINKVDRENADPNRVMQQLSEHDLVPESWGGDTIMCQVSALQGTGVDELLDNLLVVAEVEDLRASPEGRATGVVLEAHLDIGRGPVATVLVQRGTLKVGDPMVAGPAWGRIRALVDDHGRQVKVAPPSTAVQVLGLSDVAEAGDPFVVAPDERKAKSVAETRDRWKREAGRARDASVMSSGAKLEDIFAQIQAGEQASLNLIVKADVQGSLEAVTESLRKLERPEVRVGFVLRGVGGITESDIQLAATSSATIIGFNVRPSRQAREMAEAEDVEIRTYEIIYKLLEDIEAAMVGMLEPEFEEVVTGEAEVREIFRVPKVGAVAGCMVNSGVITRGSKVRFLREGTIIWKGEVSSLRRFKEDVREVAFGFECGIGLSDFQDLKAGDVIETYELKEIPRT